MQFDIRIAIETTDRTQPYLPSMVTWMKL